MIRIDHQIVLHFFKTDGTPVGQIHVAPDLEPADEWTRFCALRMGKPAPPAGRAGSFVPVWNQKLGDPFLSAFRIIYEPEGAGEPLAVEFANAYFRSLATGVAVALVERGRLETGEKFLFLPSALSLESPPAGAEPPAFAIDDVASPPQIDDGDLASTQIGRTMAGTPRRGDFPVFFREDVIARLTETSLAAPAVETGGVLLGRLRRDRAVNDLYLDVTAQLDARHTESGPAHLTFTADTWTDLHRRIHRRGRGEVTCGWWHTHPVAHWSAGEDGETKDLGGLKRDYFSDQDRRLHRLVFPAAYSVGLVVNMTGPEECSYSLFGWRKGSIDLRAFRLAPPDPRPFVIEPTDSWRVPCPETSRDAPTS